MLTELKCKKATSREKLYKLYDEKGLYLLVHTNGSRYWRFRYRVEGKEKYLARGVYPEVSLKEARDYRDEARRLLRSGTDPAFNKREKKVKLAGEDAFEKIAVEWWQKRVPTWTEKHAGNVIDSLKANVFPHIGKRSINNITTQELLSVLRKIESRGALETAGRVRQRCESVFRYAIASGRCERNPAIDLQGALAPPTKKHFTALSSVDLPEYIHRLNEYKGHIETRLALKLLLLTFVRTTELRGATWGEIDLDACEWRIPAARMKMKQDHMVPLSCQSLAVLRELRTINPCFDLVFPSRSKPHQPISNNTMLYALYRMGYHSRATGHGFRTTASTILNEMGFSPDAIERQLARSPLDRIRAAYNRAQYLDERRRMMQVWADYLDSCARGLPLFRFSLLRWFGAIE